MKAPGVNYKPSPCNPQKHTKQALFFLIHVYNMFSNLANMLLKPNKYQQWYNSNKALVLPFNMPQQLTSIVTVDNVLTQNESLLSTIMWFATTQRSLLY